MNSAERLNCSVGSHSSLPPRSHYVSSSCSRSARTTAMTSRTLRQVTFAVWHSSNRYAGVTHTPHRSSSRLATSSCGMLQVTPPAAETNRPRRATMACGDRRYRTDCVAWACTLDTDNCAHRQLRAFQLAARAQTDCHRSAGNREHRAIEFGSRRPELAFANRQPEVDVTAARADSLAFGRLDDRENLQGMSPPRAGKTAEWRLSSKMVRRRASSLHEHWTSTARWSKVWRSGALWRILMSRRQKLLITIGTSAIGVAVTLAAQAPAVTYRSHSEIASVLREKGKATPAPVMVSAPVSAGDHYQINVVHRTTPQGAIAHQVGSEIHSIMDGSGTLVTGGTLVRPSGGGAQAPGRIEGGLRQHVQKGDVVLCAAQTPHWYEQIDGTISYLEIRFDVGAPVNQPATFMSNLNLRKVLTERAAAPNAPLMVTSPITSTPRVPGQHRSPLEATRCRAARAGHRSASNHRGIWHVRHRRHCRATGSRSAGREHDHRR